MIYAVQRDDSESDWFGGLVFTRNIAYGYARDLALLSLGIFLMRRLKKKNAI